MKLSAFQPNRDLVEGRLVDIDCQIGTGEQAQHIEERVTESPNESER